MLLFKLIESINNIPTLYYEVEWYNLRDVLTRGLVPEENGCIYLSEVLTKSKSSNILLRIKIPNILKLSFDNKYYMYSDIIPPEYITVIN